MKAFRFIIAFLLFISLLYAPIFMVSVTAQETVLLQKTWGGSGDDFGRGVVADSSGNIYVTGRTTSFGAGAGDIFLLKYNSSGGLIWQKTWGGSGDEISQGLALDSTVNIYVTGYTNSYGAGSNDVFLLKFNSSGNLLWQRTWGGSGDDQGWAVAVDKPSGNIYVAGYTGGYPIGDAFLLKFNPTGSLLWQKTWGGSDDDAALGVALDSSGNVYVTGQTPSFGAGMFDAFLLKLNSSGSLLWQRTWGGGDNDGAYGVVVDSSGNVYSAGNTWSFGAGSQDVFLLKFDSAGGLLWERTWGGNQIEYDRGIALDSSGNIYLTGPTNSFGAGSYDAFLLKFDPTGALTWQKTWGGAGDDQGWCNAIDSSGNIIVTGFVSEVQPYNVGSPSVSLGTPTASLGTPSSTISTPSFTLGSPSGTVLSPSSSQTYAGGQDAFSFKYGLPATISFLTNPAVGSIYLAWTSYANGQSGNYAAGSYTAAAIIPSGYTFSGWTATGGIALSSTSSNPTTVTVTGSGSLTANLVSTEPISESTNILGLPPLLFYGILGVIVVVVAVLAFLLGRALSKKK